MKRNLIFKAFLMTLLFLMIVIPSHAAVLNIPEDTKIIEEEAFYGDTSLEEVVLPQGVEEIGEKAFAESSLQKINLPSSLENIADNALDTGKKIEVTATKGTKAYSWAVRNGFILEEDGLWAYPTLTATVSGNSVLLTIEAEEPADNYSIYEYVDGEYQWTGVIGYLTEPGTYGIYAAQAGHHIYAVQAAKYNSETYTTQYGAYIPSEEIIVAEYEELQREYPQASFMQYGKNSLRVSLSNGWSGASFDGYLIVDSTTRKTLVDIPAEKYGTYYRVDNLTPGQHFFNVSGWKLINNEKVYNKWDISYSYQIDPSDSDFLYETTEGGIKITGYRGEGNGLSIPASIDGEPVVEIDAGAFADYRGADQSALIHGRLTIPDSVRVISYNAFNNCDGLTGQLILPQALVEISGTAFEGCSHLTGPITIPGGVKYISSGAFRGCSGISGSLTVKTGVRVIDSYAFKGTSISEIVLPTTMEKLEIYAFDGCTQLEIATFQGKGTYVTDYTFNNCTKLQTIISKPDSKAWQWAESKGYTCRMLETEVPEELIYRALDSTTCEVIGYTGTEKDLIIPATNPDGLTVVRIGDRVFEGRHRYSGGSITMPASVISIGAYAFAECGDESIDIPAGVTEIGAHAFDGAWSMRALSIPTGITVIPDYAFHDCQNVQNYEIPQGVVSIGAYAFSNCGSSFVPEVEIPSSVKKIGDHAFFYNSAGLETVVLHEGLEEIGDSAFHLCSNLKKCVLPDSLTKLGKNAFNGCALTEFQVPTGITEIPEEAFSWCSFQTVEIPGTVKSIGKNAFSSDTLETLVIDEGVKSIDQYAFWCNNLNDVTIAGSVETIHDEAFIFIKTKTIKCPKNSEAWKWAERNNYTPQEI